MQFAGVFVPDAPIAVRGPIECPQAENFSRTFAQIDLCDAKSAGVQVRASAGLETAPRKHRTSHRRYLEATGLSQCVIDLNAEIKPFFKTDYSIADPRTKTRRCLIARSDAIRGALGRGWR